MRDLTSYLPTLVLVPLVGFGLYRRYKRTFGEQPLTMRAMLPRLLLLFAASIFVASYLRNASGFAAAGGGATLGVVLAVAGYRTTVFKAAATGKSYTPNKWIGMAVSALFIGRLCARFVTMAQSGAVESTDIRPFDSMQKSPLTAGIFFLMVGYYLTYYVLVLVRGRSLRASSLAESPSRGGDETPP